MTSLETNPVIVRSTQAGDGPALLRFITDLQNAEHGMHDTRVAGTPGFAQAYLRRIEARALANAGAILVVTVVRGTPCEMARATPTPDG
jgi:hypothetical protein